MSERIHKLVRQSYHLLSLHLFTSWRLFTPTYLINKSKRAQRALSQELGRTPTKEELASELGITVEKLNELIFIAKRPMSLNTKVGEYQENELGELIVDKKNDSPETELASLETKEEVAELMAGLSPQERDVIKLRYGFEDGNCHTYAKIGSILNLSRQRVHQIEKDALTKLRKASKKKQKQQAARTTFPSKSSPKQCQSS